jgi:hypothetical protein
MPMLSETAPVMNIIISMKGKQFNEQRIFKDYLATGRENGTH